MALTDPAQAAPMEASSADRSAGRAFVHMNLQHLRHFVAVAEELHFGRAAERLGMQQPPLSQSIQRLEFSLGCRLFVRAQRRIELTAAGENLLRHAPEILNLVEYARRTTIASGRTGLNHVTIGYTPNAMTDTIPKALREMKRLAPDLEVKLIEGTSSEQIARLLVGEIDIAFIPEPTSRIRGVEVKLMDRPAHVAAVPEDSPLAEKAELSLRDLADEALILVPEAFRPEYRMALMLAFREAGVMPRIAQEAVFDHARLRMVAAGLGVTFVSPMAAPSGFSGVALRPVRDLPANVGIGFSAIWRTAAPHGVRKIFEEVYATISQARQGGWPVPEAPDA